MKVSLLACLALLLAQTSFADNHKGHKKGHGNKMEHSHKGHSDKHKGHADHDHHDHESMENLGEVPPDDENEE